MTTQRNANTVDRHLGEKLRERRLEVGMTQETLADLLGITFQQIQKYEKGINRISASRLFEMTRILSVSVTYFFEDLTDKRARPKRRPKLG